MLNFRLARPVAILDIGGIESLRRIDLEQGLIRVGAMARQRDVERRVEDRGEHGLLLDALRKVAHPVIRNRGTVGGSLAHADPAGELPAALAGAGGRVLTASSRSERWIEAADLFRFHLTTSLEEDEVILEAEFPVLDERSASSVVEVTRRHGDFALAGICASLTASKDSRSIASARLAYFGVAPTPVRGVGAERLISGEVPSGPLFRAAGQAASEIVRAPESDQASAAYRRELVAVVTEKALATAAERLADGRAFAMSAAPETAPARTPDSRPPGRADSPHRAHRQRNAPDRRDEHAPPLERLVATRARPHRDSRRLRAWSLRGLHRPLGREPGPLVPPAGGPVPRFATSSRSRACRRATARSARSSRPSRQAHALQCGFCTPGFVVAVTALLEEVSSSEILSDDEIREHLAGNLCRCTGYQNLVKAVAALLAEPPRARPRARRPRRPADGHGTLR